jgi:hypothetical protein
MHGAKERARPKNIEAHFRFPHSLALVCFKKRADQARRASRETNQPTCHYYSNLLPGGPNEFSQAGNESTSKKRSTLVDVFTGGHHA